MRDGRMNEQRPVNPRAQALLENPKHCLWIGGRLEPLVQIHTPRAPDRLERYVTIRELGRYAVMQRAIDAAGPILSRRDACKLPEFPGQMCLIGLTGSRGDDGETLSASGSHAAHRGVETSYAVVVLRVETDRRAKQRDEMSRAITRGLL